MHTCVKHLVAGRVLLVVDQPVLARVIQLALAHGPYLTQIAGTSTEADAALAAWQPHLAIVDMDSSTGSSRSARVPGSRRSGAGR